MTTSPAPDPTHHTRALGWRITAVTTAAVGIIVATLWALSGWAAVADRPTHFQRTTVPGEVTLHLDEGTDAVIYVEEPRDGTSTDPAMRVQGPTGAQLTLKPYPGSLLYDLPTQPERLGHAVAVLTPSAAGTYRVAAADGAPNQSLAVAPDLAGAAVRALITPSLAFLAFVILAAVIWGAGSHRRTTRS